MAMNSHDKALTTLGATERTQWQPARHQLRGLHSIIYAHPDDRALLGTFHALPGVDMFMSWFLGSFAKREQLKLLATGFQVTETSLPSLFRCYREACDILQVEAIPKFFIVRGAANAYTMGGEDDAYVVATTELVDSLDRDELLFVLGHELGHAKAGHAKYHTLARYLRYAAEEFAQLSMGLTKTLADLTLGPTLYGWYRRSELTSDRAGLLTCQDREAALRAMTKLAGFPASAVSELRVQAILDQAASYEQQMGDHAFYRLLEIKDSLALTHPYWIIRARELQNWVDDGCYDEIVEASEAERRAMQGWVADDPQLQVVATAASQALIAWAAASWGVPRTMVGPIIRHMIYAQQPPDGTPLETLLRAELHIIKQGANDIAYTVYALVNRDGKPVLIPITVPLDSSWERVPRALREEFIRNGSSQLVRVLYTVPTHTVG